MNVAYRSETLASEEKRINHVQMRTSTSFLFLMVTIAPIALFAGCDEGDDGGGDPSSGGACSTRTEPDECAADALPQGCDVLDEQLAPGKNCDSGKRCDVVLDEPELTRVFTLTVREYDGEDAIDDEVVRDRKACVRAWLDALDLEYFSSESSAAIVVETSYAAIGPLLEWSALHSYEVSCAEDGCTHCDDLDEDDCTADPFCTVETGKLYDEDGECWSEPTFAACLRGSAFCDDAEGTARGPGGQCWAFPSLCYAEGFDYDDEDCSELQAADSCEP